MRLSPESRLVSFSFNGQDCLYRDHLGRRVVCDLEGSGRYVVRGDATAFSDGMVARKSGRFSTGVVVVMERDGEALCEVLCGPLPRTSSQGERRRDVEGCGWITSSIGPVLVDGTLEPLPAVTRFPRPFFLGASCRHGMNVVACSRQGVVRVDAFDVSDSAALKERDWSVVNGSDLFGLRSSFGDGTVHVGTHMSHLNTASWTSAIPRLNVGLIIRKLYDRFHGRQRARVLVEGEPVGIWYEPVENRTHRWAWAQFGIPASLSKGKEKVRLAVDPPAGVPLWDVAGIEVYALINQ